MDRALSDDTIQNLYVAGDNPGMGKIAARYLIDKLGGQGDIVVLRGLPTVIDDQRFDAFMELIKNTQIKVLASQYANWKRDDGFKVMQDFLTRFPKIDAVWAQDDDIALGVLDCYTKDQTRKRDVCRRRRRHERDDKKSSDQRRYGSNRHRVFAEHDRKRDRTHGAPLDGKVAS